MTAGLVYLNYLSLSPQEEEITTSVLLARKEEAKERKSSPFLWNYYHSSGNCNGKTSQRKWRLGEYFSCSGLCIVTGSRESESQFMQKREKSFFGEGGCVLSLFDAQGNNKEKAGCSC